MTQKAAKKTETKKPDPNWCGYHRTHSVRCYGMMHPEKKNGRHW